MKTKLLLTLAEIMLRVPEYAHNQKWWLRGPSPCESYCGTTLCAGGWAAFYGLGGLTLHAGEPYVDHTWGFHALAKAFGIAHDEACFLFSSRPATPLEMYDRITGFVSRHSSIAIVKDWNSMRSMG